VQENRSVQIKTVLRGGLAEQAGMMAGDEWLGVERRRRRLAHQQAGRPAAVHPPGRGGDGPGRTRPAAAAPVAATAGCGQGDRPPAPALGQIAGSARPETPANIKLGMQDAAVAAMAGGTVKRGCPPAPPFQGLAVGDCTDGQLGYSFSIHPSYKHTYGDSPLAYETIEVRVEADKVGVITLNRPKQLNALNDQLMDELGEALKAFDADEKIGCMIITGSEKPLPPAPTSAPWPSTALPTPMAATTSRATGKPSAASASP
jgi:hypothetical protein